MPSFTPVGFVAFRPVLICSPSFCPEVSSSRPTSDSLPPRKLSLAHRGFRDASIFLPPPHSNIFFRRRFSVIITYGSISPLGYPPCVICQIRDLFLLPLVQTREIMFFFLMSRRILILVPYLFVLRLSPPFSLISRILVISPTYFSQ